MLSIRSSSEMEEALASPIDDDLKHLLAQRRDQLAEYEGFDLGELVHVIVVYPGDTLDAVEAEAGVPLATNIVDDSRFGEPDFVSSFETVTNHGGWLEAVLILSDDGFGIVLLVADAEGVDPTLLGVLGEHA